MVVEPLVQGAAGMLVAAAGLSARRQRALRRARRVPDLRRGRDRLRPHRHDVRLRPGGRGSRSPLPGKGIDRRLPAARGDAHDRARLQGLPRAATTDLRTFFHGHTYTGNPLACAAAIASLDVFAEERTLERLQPKIDLFEQLIGDLVAPLDHVAEVRRRGLMCGIELCADPRSGIATTRPSAWDTRLRSRPEPAARS